MSKPKPHLEFVGVDMKAGWESPGANYPPGFTQKVLASDIDEKAKQGSRTRLLKLEPGAYSTEPFVHDHWEEVFLIQGDLIVGNDANGQGGQSSQAFTYACRPPGVRHGPFASKGGCLLYEIHYYETSGKQK
ncbi:MAG: cupin [Betaproteobacteria bacterium]|nr:cupin [Betaproteobacteria bacterium]